MAVIRELYIYPVKGCKGIRLQEAELAQTGIRYDRHWMVVDPHGKFVSQREYPRMALIGTAFEGDHLVLSAPNQSSVQSSLRLPLKTGEKADGRAGGRAIVVTVWDDRCSGFDQGPAAAQWFSNFLGATMRLVRFDPNISRRSDPTYTGDHKAYTAFSDGYALLVISEASLADLNERLDEPMVVTLMQTDRRLVEHIEHAH